MISDRERGTQYIKPPEILNNTKLAQKHVEFWASEVWAFGIAMLEFLISKPPDLSQIDLSITDFFTKLLPSKTPVFYIEMLRFVLVADPLKRPHPLMVMEYFENLNIQKPNSVRPPSTFSDLNQSDHQILKSSINFDHSCSYCIDQFSQINVGVPLFICSQKYISSNITDESFIINNATLLIYFSNVSDLPFTIEHKWPLELHSTPVNSSVVKDNCLVMTEVCDYYRRNGGSSIVFVSESGVGSILFYALYLMKELGFPVNISDLLIGLRRQKPCLQGIDEDLVTFLA
ncbi:hypothetical protein GEMRC1_006680 [Eukaryota sp. GEM-RC1]